MELSAFLFLLPVVVAFIVLWYLDSALTKRLVNPFHIDVIEIFAALIVLIVGEGIVLHFLLA